MKWSALVLSILALDSAIDCARADDVQDKVCLLNAVRQIPAITGLTPKSWTVTKEEKKDLASDIVGHADMTRLADELSRRGWIDGATSGKIRSADARGETIAAKTLASQALIDATAKFGGIKGVEVTATLMTTEVVFGAACAFDGLGSTYVESIGIVR